MQQTRATKVAVLALAMCVAMAGCGGGGGDGPAAPYGGGASGGTGGAGGSTSASVSIAGLAFTPSATTVARGTTVNWAWSTCDADGYGGQTCVSHSIVWSDGAPGAGAASEGSYNRAFANAGTYDYHCGIHGTATSGMRGSVTVQ